MERAREYVIDDLRGENSSPRREVMIALDASLNFKIPSLNSSSRRNCPAYANANVVEKEPTPRYT